ncbi:MAG: gliding motility-associated C-terminal domain-containing protein [Saprospiraceae bacterium]|nr:gliding motility-associated C-terminal domain-containing protein [Saprospiraceae bacterium]
MNHFPKTKHWTTLLFMCLVYSVHSRQLQRFADPTQHDVSFLSSVSETEVEDSPFAVPASNRKKAPSHTQVISGTLEREVPLTDPAPAASMQMCPDLTFEFNVPIPICRNTENDSVPLLVTVSGGTGNGTGTWFGPGIVDPANGVFNPLFVNAGTTTVSYLYREDDCEYTATVDLEILSTPLIAFNVAQNVQCQSDTLQAFLTTPLPPNTNPVWDLDGGQIIGGDPNDTILIRWDTPGDKWIQLQAEQSGCLSNPFPIPIRLDTPIDTPTVACDPTNSRVDFSWKQVNNAQAFVIFVVEGPNGFITSDTSYAIENLAPGQTVVVRLATISENTCPGNIQDFGCESLLCPIIEMDIDSIQPICLTGGQAQTVDLGFNLVDDSPGGGVVSWHGAGITDTLVGQITVDASMVGQENKIYLNYTNAFCTYQDSTTFQVLTESEASFSMPTAFCLGDTAEVFFTGSATANAELRWDFGGGSILAGTGLDSDPYLITWPSEGNFTTQLEVVDPGCGNDFSSQSINIAAPLPQTTINCQAGLDSVLFTWNPVAGASGFVVNVLEGPQGELLVEGEYIIRNLPPDTPVTIEVVYSSADCDGSRTTLSCSSEPCPDVNVTMIPLNSQCFSSGMTDTIPLNINLSVPGGDLSFSGAGIYDPTLPEVIITQDLIGAQNKVVATYSFGICTYQDSVTYEVFETPTASFDIGSNSCVGESLNLTYTGTAPADATLVWEFDGANILDNVGDRNITLAWDTEGVKNVSLFVASNGCFSETVVQNVMISAPVAPPTVNCTPDVDQVQFDWTTVAGLGDGQVTVLSGQNGNLLTPTSFEVSGLAPEETVEISVLFPSSMNCPDTIVTASCTTTGCPDAGVTIDPVLPICYLGPGTLNLTFVADPELSGGVPNWRGPGVIDALNGLWQLDENAIGRDNQIILDFTSGVCSFSDTIQIEVKQGPLADFTVPAQICPTESAEVVFTGTASADAVFNWDFGGGMATPGTGPGPHQVNWSSSGTFEISLSIADNGCTSGTARNSTTVLEPFITPIVDCNVDRTSITFSWDPVPGALSYDVVLSPAGVNGSFLDETTYQVTNLDPGTSLEIQVTAIDPQGCRDVTVTQSCITEECPLIKVDWDGPPAVCDGSQALITFTVSSPSVGGVDIQVSDGSNLIDLPGVVNGQELLVDLNGSTTFTITQISIPGAPECSLEIPDPITINVNGILTAGTGTDPAPLCNGNDQSFDLFSLLNGEDAGGIWTEVNGNDANGAFNPNAGSFVINETVEGTFQFQYIVAGGAPCPNDTSFVSFTVNPTPVAAAGQDVFLDCLSSMATLGGSETSAGMVYEWELSNMFISDQQNIEVEMAGNYLFRVTDPATGCSAEDLVEVSAYDDFFVPFVSVSPVTCDGEDDGFLVIDSIVGTASGVRSSLNGSPLADSRTYGPLGPGVYELMFTDAQGCEQSFEYILDVPSPVIVNLQAKLNGTDNMINIGDSVVLEALVNVAQDQIQSITWNPALPGSEDNLSVLVKPEFSSTYEVTVTDLNGCVSTASIDILVNRNINVFMANVFRPGSASVNNIFMVQGGAQINTVLKFLIFDRWGNKVFENVNFPPNDPTEGWDGTYRNQLLNAGVYVYWLDVELTNGEVMTLKGDIALIR